MKALITTTLALGVLFTLANQSVEAQYYYNYYDAPGYVVNPYSGYGGYYGNGYYNNNRGLVPQVLNGLLGGGW